jgi:hypothetical protein
MAKFATQGVASAKRTPAWRDLIDGDAFGNPSCAAASAARMHAALSHLHLNAKRGFRLDQGYGALRQHHLSQGRL